MTEAVANATYHVLVLRWGSRQ